MPKFASRPDMMNLQVLWSTAILAAPIVSGKSLPAKSLDASGANRIRGCLGSSLGMPCWKSLTETGFAVRAAGVRRRAEAKALKRLGLPHRYSLLPGNPHR